MQRAGWKLFKETFSISSHTLLGFLLCSVSLVVREGEGEINRKRSSRWSGEEEKGKGWRNQASAKAFRRGVSRRWIKDV